VVTLDLPGFGESEPVGPGFDLGEVAERIMCGLDDACVAAPFDLVGHSLGAGIALTLAAEHAPAVRRLVLVSPAGLSSMPRAASLLLSAGADIALAARRRAGALADFGWGRRLLLGLAAADPAAIAPTQARMMIRASAGAQRTSEAFATITGTDLRPLLLRAGAPIGVIWGERDRTIPVRLADVVRAQRPEVEVTVVPGAGHVLMVERPEAFVDALEGLLATLPKDATTPRSPASTVP
jgi:pimeloyl-ACP methyl ester carboxylesterase